MSLYNIIHWVTKATFFFAPMVIWHPQEWIARFRDCFLKTEGREKYDGKIQIYTKIGGGNRKDYQDEIDRIRSIPGYVTDFDNESDETYATFVFDVPKEWEEDAKKILDGKMKETSEEYKSLILKTFPGIADQLKIALY